jgi:hypothetical protein
MKYSSEIVVNVPRDRFIELFDNPDNMSKWQPGLVSFTPLSGTPGHPGAQSKLVYAMGSRTVEMIETITLRNLPDEFAGTYGAKGVHNIVSNRFSVTGPDGRFTHWIIHCEFQCTGFMRLMTLFMPGAFKKETRKMLQNFKEFAERTVAVA